MAGTLNTVLNNMYQAYALVFPPASIMEIQRTSIQLVKQGLIQIPADYIQFLSLTDGLNWNGLELFSIGQHERKDCVFPNLQLLPYQKTQELKPLFPKSLILGIGPEHFILYEAPKKEYVLLSRYTFVPVVRLPRFADVLYFYWSSFSNAS
ncbi:MAG: hypothetical protein ACI4OR_02350 [Alphaproteobacteria bacterium]